jgi:hypothetical protein
MDEPGLGMSSARGLRGPALIVSARLGYLRNMLGIAFQVGLERLQI